MRQGGVAHIDVLFLGFQLVVENVGRDVDQLEGDSGDPIDFLGALFDLKEVEGGNDFQVVVLKLLTLFENPLYISDPLCTFQEAGLVTLKLKYFSAKLVGCLFKHLLQRELPFDMLNLLMFVLVEDDGLMVLEKGRENLVLEKGIEAVSCLIDNDNCLLKRVKNLDVLLHGSQDLFVQHLGAEEHGEENKRHV